MQHKHSLDVVQTSRVWFEDGRVMEHLIESDAEEDYIELKHTQTPTSVNIPQQARGIIKDTVSPQQFTHSHTHTHSAYHVVSLPAVIGSGRQYQPTINGPLCA